MYHKLETQRKQCYNARVQTYPINLVGLGQQRCVVVGGGQVALRKVEGLLAAGAQVVVVAPQLDARLRLLAEADGVAVRARAFEPGDLDGTFLVVAATDDPDVNRAVSAEALRRGLLVNVVDDSEASNFIVPAVVRRGELVIAVSTGGASPALARRVREALELQFGPEYVELVNLLAELRPAIMARFPPGEARLEAALRLVDAGLPALIRERGRGAALAHARSLLGLD